MYFILTGWGYRHLVAFMAFLGFFNVYCLRVNLSVAMVAMVNSSDVAKNDSNECPSDNTGNSTSTKVLSRPLVSEFDPGPVRYFRGD